MEMDHMIANMNLVEELKKEYDDYEEVKKHGTFRNTKGREITINGLKCRINFFGTHYCGYVLDNSIDWNEGNLDYIPHGGLTHPYGFDCAHLGDIVLYNFNGTGFPYEPKSMFSEEETFKTRKFVINELDRLTKAILKLA